jgi:Protein of unknown function (DUF3551)
MMRILWIAAIAVAAMTLQQRPVQASEAPWCAVVETGLGSVHWDCQYASVEACVPNVLAGNRGTCNQNPYYQGAAKPKKHVARRRHSVQQ